MLDASKGSMSPIRLPAIIAEFLGSLFIELVAGVITVVSADSGLVTGAMGVGFAFTTVMFIFRGVSGAHMNPAVTMGVMASSPPLAYEFNLIQGLAYIVSQVSGAVAGAVLCAHLVPMEVDIVDRSGSADEPAVHHTRSVSFLARGVLSSDHGLSVFLFELICTFAIVWTYFATMIDPRSRKRTGGFGPLAVGLGIIVGVLAEGPGTGGTRGASFPALRNTSRTRECVALTAACVSRLRMRVIRAAAPADRSLPAPLLGCFACVAYGALVRGGAFTFEDDARVCAASMSPARTIAPAVAFGVYSHMVAPLLGTILGGLGAGMMYSYLFMFKPDEVPDACVPLRGTRKRARACASVALPCLACLPRCLRDSHIFVRCIPPAVVAEQRRDCALLALCSRSTLTHAHMDGSPACDRAICWQVPHHVRSWRARGRAVSGSAVAIAPCAQMVLSSSNLNGRCACRCAPLEVSKEMLLWTAAWRFSLVCVFCATNTFKTMFVMVERDRERERERERERARFIRTVTPYRPSHSVRSRPLLAAALDGHLLRQQTTPDDSQLSRLVGWHLHPKPRT
jgi:glycerol uptake facilitator-like aquaporin